jgi:hypothetical protein
MERGLGARRSTLVVGGRSRRLERIATGSASSFSRGERGGYGESAENGDGNHNSFEQFSAAVPFPRLLLLLRALREKRQLPLQFAVAVPRAFAMPACRIGV